MPRTPAPRPAPRLTALLLALVVALTGLAVVGTTSAAGAARADFAPMRIGDTGWRVRELQSRLHQLDLHSEVVTSRFDGETRTGVVTFQRRRGWGAEGVVDERTWLKIVSLTTEPLDDAAQDRDTLQARVDHHRLQDVGGNEDLEPDEDAPAEIGAVIAVVGEKARVRHAHHEHRRRDGDGQQDDGKGRYVEHLARPECDISHRQIHQCRSHRLAHMSRCR